MDNPEVLAKLATQDEERQNTTRKQIKTNILERHQIYTTLLFSFRVISFFFILSHYDVAEKNVRLVLNNNHSLALVYSSFPLYRHVILFINMTSSILFNMKHKHNNRCLGWKEVLLSGFDCFQVVLITFFNLLIVV